MLSHDARQTLRPTGARHEATLDFGKAEASCVCSIREIATQHHFGAATQSQTIHGTDDRNGAALHREVVLLEDDSLGCPLSVGHAVAFLQVTTDAERAVACASQDDAKGTVFHSAVDTGEEVQDLLDWKDV